MVNYNQTRIKNFNFNPQKKNNFGIIVRKSIGKDGFETVDAVQFQCKPRPLLLLWSRRWPRRRLVALLQSTGWRSWRRRSLVLAIGYKRRNPLFLLFLLSTGRCPRAVHLLAKHLSRESIKRTEYWHHHDCCNFFFIQKKQITREIKVLIALLKLVYEEKKLEKEVYL